MNRSRIQIAKPDIVSYFDSLPVPVLKEKDLHAILAEQRQFWRLTQSMTARQFIEFLIDHSKLKAHEFAFPQRAQHCYAWGDVPLLQVLQGLKKNVYFSHYTAMRALGLTEQVPSTIYLTDERSAGYSSGGKLSQESIDHAFSQPARTSNKGSPRFQCNK